MSLFSFGSDDDSPDPAPTPDPSSKQFSTGPQPVSVGTEWRKFDFGFRANSVSVRGDEPVVVAFARPFDQPDRHITVADNELPFSLGGDTPVNAEAVWVKRAPTASSDPNVQIIAL